MVHTSGFRMSPYADIKPAGGLNRHRHRRRGPQAVAPQPGERRMTAARTLAPRVGAHGPPPRTPYRRPHRGGLGRRPRPARGQRASSRSSTSAAAPAGSRSGWPPRATGSPSSTPAPTPWPPSPAEPTRRAWPTGSPVCRATSATCASWRPRRVSTWSCATACSASSMTRPARWTRSPRCCGPAAPSRCWSASGTPPCWPGRWPVTSPRPGPSSMPSRAPTGDPRAGEHRFTAEELTGLLEGAGLDIRSTTASASSPTWCPPRCSTSSRGPSAALLELERAVSERPEYLTLASQLHVVATR